MSINEDRLATDFDWQTYDELGVLCYQAEHRMLAYLLYGAIKDAFCANKDLRRSARQWLADGPVAPPGFTFRQVREELRLGEKTVERIRRLLSRPKDRRAFHRLAETL